MYKQSFQVQRWHAINTRGIEWKLTYEEWLDIWGDKITQRGRGRGKYNMCRYGDTGAYEVGNVYIDKHEVNANHGKADAKHLMKPCRAENVLYESVASAARAVGVDGRTILNRIQQNVKGYEYV